MYIYIVEHWKTASNQNEPQLINTGDIHVYSGLCGMKICYLNKALYRSVRSVTVSKNCEIFV